MKPAHKGQLVGLLAGVAITIAWVTATTGREGDCIDPGLSWSDGCQCDPISAGTFAATGMAVIVPCMMIAGSMLAAFAARLPRHRPLVLAAITTIATLLLAGIAGLFRQCSTDPTTTTLFVRALVPTLAATAVLELATRPAYPVARIRDTSRLRRDMT